MATPSSSEASSSRFTLLPSNYLASQPPLSETTLPSLIAASQRLSDEAREALPYSFDTCTYMKGYLRQSVWSCLDCGEKGVCYGCAISCHGEHKLVELWTRRHFRCDCPTTSMVPSPSSASSSFDQTAQSSSKRRKCTLNPPEAQPQEPNGENRYGPNFRGTFCRCGRDYDPETEKEAMVVCIGCEDWFHESCLNLRPSGPPNDAGGNAEDEEGDEDDSLIPSESYDGLICAQCVRSNDYVVKHAGEPGWMIIEPSSDGSLQVIGSQSSIKRSDQEVSQKRWLESGDDVATESPNNHKKVKLDNGLPTPPASGVLVTATPGGEGESRPESSVEQDVGAGRNGTTWWKGKGDVFLANGIRDRLKKELPSDIIAGLPFPLEDAEIYEPPQDEDQEETIEQVTERVVQSLPRVQAIEALHGYQAMKDKLKTMLASRAENDQAVSKEDIDSFFQELRQSRR